MAIPIGSSPNLQQMMINRQLKEQDKKLQQTTQNNTQDATNVKEAVQKKTTLEGVLESLPKEAALQLGAGLESMTESATLQALLGHLSAGAGDVDSALASFGTKTFQDLLGGTLAQLQGKQDEKASTGLMQKLGLEDAGEEFSSFIQQSLQKTGKKEDLHVIFQKRQQAAKENMLSHVTAFVESALEQQPVGDLTKEVMQQDDTKDFMESLKEKQSSEEMEEERKIALSIDPAAQGSPLQEEKIAMAVLNTTKDTKETKTEERGKSKGKKKVEKNAPLHHLPVQGREEGGQGNGSGQQGGGQQEQGQSWDFLTTSPGKTSPSETSNLDAQNIQTLVHGTDIMLVIAMLFAEKASNLEGVMELRLDAYKALNDKIDALNQALEDVNKDLGIQTNTGDADTAQGFLTQGTIDELTKLGISVGDCTTKPGSGNCKVSYIRDIITASIRSKIDATNANSQTQMFSLQNSNTDRTNAWDTASNASKKVTDALSKLADNF